MFSKDFTNTFLMVLGKKEEHASPQLPACSSGNDYTRYEFNLGRGRKRETSLTFFHFSRFYIGDIFGTVYFNYSFTIA